KNLWQTEYKKAERKLKVIARDEWDQTASAEISVLVDHPVEADLQACQGASCKSLSDGTELTGIVKLKVEAKDDGAAIGKVEFHADGNLVSVDNSAPWEYSLDTETLGDGFHTLKAVAVNTLSEKGQDTAEVLVNNCDLDHDTYLAQECGGSDCEDLNPDKNPGKPDTVGNGVDDNCDGIDGIDGDGDGYASKGSGGTDCDDAKAAVNPGKPDTVGNGVDDNCDGIDGVDADGDGHASLTSGGEDCDDLNPDKNPGKPDTVGNGVDDNCDGMDGVDADGDGYASKGSGGTDCDDAKANVNPGKPDTVGNGVDDNCDGIDGVDADGDGHASLASGGKDCDDLNPNKNPGKPDTVGNGVDDNCDGIDGVDGDGDGYASKGSGGKDCDDAKGNVHPCADDVGGDGLDANCDGKDAASCDDCDPCTQDQVDGAGCKHTTMGEGQLCDDGDACTTGEKCNGGKCGGGAAVGCDDGDVCTLDACDPVSGCTHVPDPLKAGQPCPGGVCFGGACCAAACAGKECGDDGCGGSCGTCAQGKKCGPQGKCVDPTALVWKPIPGGTFMMGCSPGDGDCFSDEKPSHSVTLSPFQILETEVTEAQYFKVTGKDPSCDWGDGGGPDSPVECVDWYESKAFCEAVAPKGRLCTEAEWEYAARGGTTTKYYCGDNASCLGGIAWYGSNSGDHKHDVKGKAPNAYGLYDMLGNVWEWTADWYSSGYYSVSPANNPQGPNSGSYRVERGGGFGHDDYYLRVSYRSAGVPSDVYDGLGLRCCRSVQP
ncbi:MAG: hypothetical protein FJ109_18210, partial [Deltaproteobacteria bacterium]|nr:hypothetical protein [Deltaproteobacteria bacterium]